MKPVDAMFKHGRAMLEAEFKEVREEFEFMDLFGFTVDGDTCEIEIKTADYDFHKEFKRKSKVEKHAKYMDVFFNGADHFCPTRYYFLVNKNMTDLVLRKLREKGLPYGILQYDTLKDRISLVKKSERLTKKRFLGEFNQYITKARDFKHKRSNCG